MNLVSYLKTYILIILSSVSSQYVKFISFLRPLIWSSHPILSSQYVNLVNYFKNSYPIILSHPLHPSPGVGGTWTWSIAFFKDSSDHFVLSSPESTWDQSFEFFLSDHPIPSSSSSSSRTYAIYVNWLKTSHPIISSRPLQSVCELGQLLESSSSYLIILFLFIPL